MTRPKQVAALLLAGAFVLGGAVGWTAARTVVPRAEAAPAAGAPAAAAAAPGSNRMLDEFTRELGLDAAQRAAVDSILDERRRVMDSLVTPLRPQLDSVRDEARTQIRRRLTPEQQARFADYLARTAAAAGAPGGASRGAAKPPR